MYRPIAFFIGFRYLLGKGKDRFARFISWLSTIGIILGVMALIIVISVMNGLEREIKQNTLHYMIHAYVTQKDNKIDKKEFPKEMFLNLENIKTISTLVTTESILQGKNGVAITHLIGLDPNENNEAISPYIRGETLDSLKPRDYQIIIGRSLANQLGVYIGDQIRVMLTQSSQITPIGRIPSQRLFEVSGIFMLNSEIEQRQAYVHYDDLRRLLRLNENEITGWRFELDDPFEIISFSKQELPEHLIFKDWREEKGDFFRAVNMEKKMMAMLVSLIILVAAFNIITSLGLLVMEKQSEVAILQTQGLSQGKIMSIFIIQGATAGIFGAILGTFLGLLVVLNINKLREFLGFASHSIQLPVLIDFSQIAFIAFSAIIIALLSTIYPARYATKILPVEALRYE